MSGEAERSETTAPIVAALRQEGDAWDRAGDHYRADLLHGAADEIERLRDALGWLIYHEGDYRAQPPAEIAATFKRFAS